MNKSRAVTDKKVSQLPNWLWSNSNVLPPMYRRIWEAVRDERSHLGSTQGELLVDTKKVFPLLLTSQLPTEVLGYIWGLANQKYSGKLTEQELYVVLALVAVAQASYPFANLEVLHLLPGPPEPRLNLTLIYPNAPQISTQQDITTHSDDISTKRDLQGRSLHKTNSVASAITIPGLVPNHSHMGETKIDSKLQSISTPFPKSSSDAESEVGGASSVLSDGKPATINSSSSTDWSDEFSDFQSAPVAQPAAPSIPMWDTKHGSAIGSRLANHNLGVKKSSDKQKKVTSASGSGGKMHGVAKTISSTSEKSNASLSSLGGKDLLPSVERLGEIFPKCAVKNQAKTVILKDTVIRNNDPPKNIRESASSASIDKIEIPPPTKQTVAKHVAANSPKISENSSQDLMNLQQSEDKYSALRVLVDDPNIVESNSLVEKISATSTLSLSDDFGDFVSAEQPKSSSSSAIIATSSSFGIDESSDFLNNFERSKTPNSVKKQTEATLNVKSVGEAFGKLDLGTVLDGHSTDEKYDGNVETDKFTPKEDTISVNSMELGNGSMGVITRSNSVPSLDLKSFLAPNADEEQQQVENMHQMIYWEWKQYMESCVLLLQTAANVFGGITTDAVLQEVIASAQGYNFLCNLAEVAAVCRRVNFSHKEMDINIMGFDDLLMDIDRIWAEMEPFYANIPIVTELPVWPLHQSESSACCALCLTIVTSGRIVYNDNTYHVTCANLWLNCVNHNLPILRYPPSSVVSSHSMPITSTGNNQI